TRSGGLSALRRPVPPDLGGHPGITSQTCCAIPLSLQICRTPAKNKQAAWTFMKWLATSDYAVANYTVPAEGSIPPLVNLGAKAKALLESTPDYKVYTNQIIPTVVRPPWGAAYTNAYPVMMTSIQQVMTTSASPASVASSMQSNLKSALAGAG
ncbi:MAG: hypothetical protein ACRDX8_13870, partial [Acidimicrobiales bacterium]